MDWNSDGRRDLVSGDRGGYFSYFIQGTSQLTAYYKMRLQNGDTLDVGTNSYPQVTDWNRDGKKDLLVGNEDGYIRLYLNVGTDAAPVFQNYSYINSGGSPINLFRIHPVVIDLDRDGKRDLVCGTYDGYMHYFRNVGTDTNPAFSGEERLRTTTGTYIRVGGEVPYVARAGFADWNNDGRLDFIFSGYDGWLELYLGASTSGKDVGVTRIAAPAGIVDSGTYVTPACSVYNYGTVSASYTVRMRIGTGYNQTAGVTNHAPDAVLYVTFPQWTAQPPGTFTASCSTEFTGDEAPQNNKKTRLVAVRGNKPTGWQRAAGVPAMPSGKDVKDGGWLTYDASTGLVYAAKGNKTADYYGYDPDADTWRQLASIPEGREAKPPSKGAVGCADGIGSVYATKGNNTAGFWKYVGVADSWYEQADVPLGVTEKNVKGGTDLVFVPGAGGPDYVYLLKGYKNEFWRYDVMKDSWQALADAPLGTSGKNKYDKGSWLVYDNQNTIYCHKAKYHELFTYDVALGTWTAQLSGMPFVGMSGKSKRSKDGGSAAFLYGNTYALKGGNTQEFWQYDPGTDSWTELDTMPQVGSSGRKKKVKAGGDLTAATDALYALKGNKTNELWWYVPAAGTGCRASGGAEGTMSGARTIDDHRLTISPNPLRPGFALLRLDGRAALSSSGPVTVGIFDAAGRCMLSSTFESRTSSFVLDLRSMHAGVYVVRLAAGRFGVTQKLVVDN